MSSTFKHGLTVHELCAGGGRAAVLAKAGFRHVGLLKREKAPCQTLRAIVGDVMSTNELRELLPASLSGWQFQGKPRDVNRQIANAFPMPVAFRLGLEASGVRHATQPERICNDLVAFRWYKRTSSSKGLALTCRAPDHIRAFRTEDGHR